MNFIVKRILTYVTDRLSETSTVAGIIKVCGSMTGLHFSDSTIASLTFIVIGLDGFLRMLLPDNLKKKDGSDNGTEQTTGFNDQGNGDTTPTTNPGNSNIVLPNKPVIKVSPNHEPRPNKPSEATGTNDWFGNK